MTFSLSYPGRKAWESSARLASSVQRWMGWRPSVCWVCPDLLFSSGSSHLCSPRPGFDELAIKAQQASVGSDDHTFSHSNEKGKSMILSCQRLPPQRGTKYGTKESTGILQRSSPLAAAAGATDGGRQCAGRQGSPLGFLPSP